MRGFIVIEESGLPKYIEFLTEEQIDIILLSGLLTGLQALSEVVSEERIKTIETTNSKFIFEQRANYFYVIWIEKSAIDLELYEPIIMKIISRFEGASEKDKQNSYLISNLDETPEYEKIGRRLVKFRSKEARYFDAYKRLEDQSQKGLTVEKIAEILAGIDGVLVISEEGDILHQEFSRGEAIFQIETFTNFIVGLRKSIKNLDPGILEEVTTQNYRFIIREGFNFFYVFEVIKGLSEAANLRNTLQKIMARYEGLRRRDSSNIAIFKDIDQISEHDLLGQLSIEMRELQKDDSSLDSKLKRETSKISFGADAAKWIKEENQLHSFMDIYKEVFISGIICPTERFFVAKKTLDINDWIESVNNLEIGKLQSLLKSKAGNNLVKLTLENKLIRLAKIKENSILFVMFDNSNSAAERYMLRLSSIIEKVSNNVF